jgi:polyisoprenoid-binding protein YceI
LLRVKLQPGVVVVVLATALISPATGQQGAGSAQIDSQKSLLTIRVYKTGLFSAFAHNHEIHGPIQRGSFDEQKRTVEFVVDAKQLRVVDREGSASDRIQVQANMQGPKVLDIGKFPEIEFRSTGVDSAGAGKWIVHGDLTLHGQTHPVKVEVQGERGHYTGSATLKQTDFGITPITIAGGAVKVKDEVRVEFEVFGN